MEHEAREDSVAVIGMSCRFPGAVTTDEFWKNLCDGVESISQFTEVDLAELGIDPQVMRHPSYVNARGVVADVDMFDASFFGYSPREAEILDPQQRLFLECAWEALESAGHDPETYTKLIGVYAGVGMSKYVFNLYANPGIASVVGPYQISLANDKDHLTTRVAYKLNLRGPAITIQTACSTSLVAVCTACRSLLDYHCDMALAGGVTIDLPQNIGYFYQEGGIASPDGHCRAFDASAQGTVGGNGAGVVLLKRLSDAIADNDTIHAVILGSAVNNDGSVKIGYTAPSIDGQATAIALAHAVAGVDAESVTYIEAHGTGTTLGDPIELAALTQVYRAQTESRQFCAIGSVKTNIGHLDTAAGVAGLIKAVQALKHGQLPPSLHFVTPNPKMEMASSPFFVNTELTAWKNGSTPRRAGVSSFGIGGTNAHVVVEEPPSRQSSASARSHQLIALSARTSTALDAASQRLSGYLDQRPDLNLADVAYTHHVGRRHFGRRQALVASDVADAARGLVSPSRAMRGAADGGNPPVAFLFPGQGSQYLAMAEGIYQTEPLFREIVDDCSQSLVPYLRRDLRELLFPGSPSDEAEGLLRQTAVTQPALFVVEYALSQLWMSWGVRPVALIGHSIGEYTAACLAGVLTLDDALRLVALRGALMQDMPGGAMLAVMLPEQELLPLLNGGLSLAAVNTPADCVVSGPGEAVEALEAKLTASGVGCRRLRTSHAFHSGMMDPMLDEFRQQLQTVDLHPPKIPFVSNMTGDWITADEATDPEYWTRHARETVRFADGVQQLLRRPEWILLEVGPGRTLTSLAQQHPAKESRQLAMPSLRHANEAQPDEAFLLTTLGKLWVAGTSIDWQNFYSGEQRLRIPLPTYPFERQRFWVDPPKPTAAPAPMARTTMDQWFYAPDWQRSPAAANVYAPALNARWLVFIDDQGIGQQVIDRLERDGEAPTVVLVGKGFARLSECAYTVAPGSKDDLTALVDALRARSAMPTHIVHGWGLTDADASLSDNGDADARQDAGFYTLLFLAQALGNAVITDPVQITVVANNVFSVTGDETVCPDKATVLGPCIVLPQEHPNIACRLIDIALPESDAQQAGAVELAENLLAECVGSRAGRVVAYRGGERWERMFTHVDSESHGGTDVPLRERGVYLITGGVGGMGLVLAEHLARTVNARLALISRSAFPAPEDWSRYLEEHDEDDTTARRIRKLREIEALGAETLVLRADVADIREMQTAVDTVRSRFGALHGVIHAAGVPAGGIIQLKTREEAARIMAPKVTGARVLDSVIGDEPLDFMALCSSLASVLGGAGQVDYCAANAFLDAFAHAARGKRRTVAINWDRWQDVGMAVETRAPADLQRDRAAAGWDGIHPAEGVRAFERALQISAPQIAIATVDIRAFMDPAPMPAGTPSVVDDGRQVISQPLHDRPALSSAYIAPETDAERQIVEILEQFLGVQPVGVQDNFFELGGHSLLAIQVVSRLSDRFQVKLPMQIIFDAPSAAALAEAIETMRWSTPNGEDPVAVAGQEYEEGEIG